MPTGKTHKKNLTPQHTRAHIRMMEMKHEDESVSPQGSIADVQRSTIAEKATASRVRTME
jgi:hypothetical protein